MSNKWYLNSRYQDLLVIIGLILLNVLPRLAFFLNPGFFIDPDEAIFGTMVRSFLNNGHLPLFFYGQNYALVSFEVFISAVISYFGGINIFSLKVAMLLFWLASIAILFYIGKKVFNDRRWAFLSVFLISAVPAWFDWASKARGGYITALLFSNIIILLTLIKKSNFRLVMIALLLVLIYYTQPLWLVITGPFVVYYLFSDYKSENFIVFVTNFLVFLIGSRFLLFVTGNSYQDQSRMGFVQLAHNIHNIFNYFYIGYSGRFFYTTILGMSMLTAFVSGLFVIILILAIGYYIYLICRKKITGIEIALLAAVILYIIVILFSSDTDFSYRYLLPIYIPSIFLIVLAAKNFLWPSFRNGLYIFLTIYAALSLVSGTFFHNYMYPAIADGSTEVERIKSVETVLNNYRIKCAYVLDWDIAQHFYYFLPNIITRYQKIDFRQPQKAYMVDSMFRQGGNCALIGWTPHLSLLKDFNPQDIIIVKKRYMIDLRPQKSDLLRLGFELTN